MLLNTLPARFAYPNDSTRIKGLDVHEGDSVFVEVWSTSPTVGHAFMVNYNTQEYVSIDLMAPPGVQLAGGSVEWITERLSLSICLANLTNFISEYVSSGYALDNNGEAYTLADSTPVIMVDPNLQPISYPTLLGTNAMWCRHWICTDATATIVLLAPVGGAFFSSIKLNTPSSTKPVCRVER